MPKRKPDNTDTERHSSLPECGGHDQGDDSDDQPAEEPVQPQPPHGHLHPVGHHRGGEARGQGQCGTRRRQGGLPHPRAHGGGHRGGAAGARGRGHAEHGIGGGGGGLMTGRSAANFLTRTTATLATLFFVTSLVLAILASGSSEPRSIIDTTAPATNSQEPSAPLAR